MRQRLTVILAQHGVEWRGDAALLAGRFVPPTFRLLGRGVF